MSSDDVAIRVEDLGKRYEIYDTPRDRLKQFFMPHVRRMLSLKPKSYCAEFWALRNVSFEIKKGGAFGVVGRNGSGKSTLLQLLTGTLTPTTGTIESHGRIAALLELGSGFNPNFTGRENVFLNGLVLGLSRQEVEDRFDAIAGFADIGEHLEQPMHTYSSGMLVRLAFAVQVQVQPDILIIDEALAVGDAVFQKRCFDRIEKLKSDGVTLIFVSHNQEWVRTLTKHALLLNNGNTMSYGNSSDVILAYRKQLHKAETTHFGNIASRIEHASGEPDTERQNDVDSAEIGKHPEQKGSSESFTATDSQHETSFGDGGVHILSVQTFAVDGTVNTAFYPRDRLRICIKCLVDHDIDKINVSVRIRNKEGVKIYSWGTLSQDQRRLYHGQDGPVFWEHKFRKGQHFSVWFDCDCMLGPNFYEIQACVSHEEQPESLPGQRILHWVDEAAFFQVDIQPRDYFFAGCVDLGMQASWEENE